MNKIYVCDYIDIAVNDVESFIIEAVSDEDAELKAIEELKSLKIPKRYLLNVEEVF